MSEIYLTTRKGNINDITLYRYDFTSKALSYNDKKKQQFRHWLKVVSQFPIYEIADHFFYTYEKLSISSTPQFRLKGFKTIQAPFANTQIISTYIANIMRKQFAKKFSQFLNQNVFSVEKIQIYPFSILKCFEFNIEVFENGDYYINFLPTTKIISSCENIKHEYVEHLKQLNQNNSKTESMPFSLIETSRFYKKKIDLLAGDLPLMLNSYLTPENNFIASFDYHFIANYSPDIFGQITEITLKDLTQSVHFINKAIDKFQLPDFFNLTENKFFKVNMIDFSDNKNLLVGSTAEKITVHSKINTQYGLRIEFTKDDIALDELHTGFVNNEDAAQEIHRLVLPTTIWAKIEKKAGWNNSSITKISRTASKIYTNTKSQSSAYHNGIFKCVEDWNVLPLLVGENQNVELLHSLFHKFNKDAQRFNILKSIDITDELNIELIKGIIQSRNYKTLIIVITKYKLTSDFFEDLKQFNTKIQIYQGDINNLSAKKLSNFVCACLEKMGGIVSLIDENYISDTGYFLGIDLGHSTFEKTKYSNLAVAVFNRNGLYIGHHIEKKIILKENLTQEHCTLAFQRINTLLSYKKLSSPKHLIIHRDGKLHKNDLSIILSTINSIWGDIKVDVIEVIKSGYPVIAIKENYKVASLPKSGMAYLDEKNKYAILVTNDQAKKNVLNPIIIKHKYGCTSFANIVEQVFWFTKIYTSNLYYSTRLPATTLKANNVVGTSSKQHYKSYLG